MKISYLGIIFIIIIITSLIGLKIWYDNGIDFINETEEKMKEDGEFENYSDKFKLPIDNFSVDFENKLNYNNAITTNFKIKNTLNEVIENASIDIKIYLKYKSDNYILTSFHNSEKLNLGEITNLKSKLHNIKISSKGFYLDSRELGNLINVNLKPYLKDHCYGYSVSYFESYINDKDTKCYYKSLRILDSIEKKYNNVWFPDETKDLSILFPIEVDSLERNFYRLNNRYFKDKLIVLNKDNKKLPNAKLFVAENIFLEIFLNAKNSKNLGFKSKIYSGDITNEWNSKYIHEKIRETNRQRDYKVLNELLIPIKTWKIIDETYIEKLDIGTLLLGNKIETDEFNYFAFLYQKHSIPILEDYAQQEKVREIRTFKNAGMSLQYLNTSKLIFNKKYAIQYSFKGKFKDNDFNLKMLVFKHNDYYYKISYKVDKNSENLIKIIKIKG